MPISYKHKIYTTLGTPTGLSGNVVSATDSAGVPAKDYTIKGRSIVWNQLLDKSKYPATGVFSGVTYTNNGDGTITLNGTATATTNYNLQSGISIMENHKYFCYYPDIIKDSGVYVLLYTVESNVFDKAYPATGNDIVTALKNYDKVFFQIKVSDGKTVSNLIVKPQFFDLTQMFGAGNEPSTREEFWAYFNYELYPYNAGELKGIMPTSVEASGVERFQMLDKSKYPATGVFDGVTYTNNGDGTITLNGTATATTNYNLQFGISVIANHKYFCVYSNIFSGSGAYPLLYTSDPAVFNTGFPMLSGDIITAFKDYDKVYFQIKVSNGKTMTNMLVKPQLFDLTEMFGAGNEPATVAEFWQRVPEKLYSYNPDAYKRVNIPSSKYFPDGMRSAGSAYDEINFLSQKAIKRVGVRAYQTGDENDANVMTDKINTVYILATPVETAITPPLQALPTYKGFTSFSAPNTLTQNGPLSVTYYAEGGTNPEKGWLTSYKRKLYMGRNIEWNQLVDKSKFQNISSLDGISVTNNNDGSIMFDGIKTQSVSSFFNCGTYQIKANHKYYLCGAPAGSGFGKYQLYSAFTPIGGSTVYSYDNGDGVFFRGQESLSGIGNIIILISQSLNAVSNLVFKPQLFDLTQMFGAGNEPTTPEEFWSYFDHKLYPYNAGETQPLFKISRKSQWGALPKHYTARWDKVNAAMVRLNDAASFPTDVTNFAYRGIVNANYSNPFDNIYPWSGIKLCNISIDLYRDLAAGDSITKCVTAWEGDANFSYNDTNGVWRYRPEFWGKSWEDDTYRYFDVTDQNVHGSNYVHYPEAIVGRWHGRKENRTIGGEEKGCLIPSVGMPAKRIAMSTLHTYAKNYGATIDSIYSIDADTLLCIVEFATMNTQNAIGEGVSDLYRQSSDLIQEDATNSTTVKVLAAAGSAYCIPGAIFDIGTSNGGNQVGSFTVISATPNVIDAQYLDVTLDQAVTVTGANYWSVHGLVNVADEAIGSKSGYIGENGKCNAYYRGIVMFGNMWLYTLGAYENKDDHHIWIANSGEEVDNYDALDTTAHYDTGRVLPTAVGYTKKLALLSRSGLLSIPAFCVETGGNSSNPVGDYFYNGAHTYNTVFLCGGSAHYGSNAGAFCSGWNDVASSGRWNISARPRLKNP